MKKSRPFNVQYNISFSGITKIDGVVTVTSGMIRDKLLEVLEKALVNGSISQYRMSAEVNLIQEVKTKKKMKREGKGEVKSKRG